MAGIGIGTALAIGSTAVSAGSAIISGQQQAAVAEAQAKARQQRAEFQAQQQREQAEVQEQRAEERQRNAQIAEIQAKQRVSARLQQLEETLGTQTAAAAAQGLTIGPSGSLDAIQQDTQKQARRDITNIRFLGANKERRSRISAKNTRKSAENTRESARLTEATGQTIAQIGQQQASNARLGGFLSAGQSLLAGGQKLNELGAFDKPAPTPQRPNIDFPVSSGSS